MARQKSVKSKAVNPDMPFAASDFFGIHDVFLWNTCLTREADYELDTHEGKLTTQTMRSVNPSLIRVQFEGEEDAHGMLRALVSFGVRNVFRQDDSAEEVVLNQLETTFAVEFFLNEEEPPPPDKFSEFISKNCYHIAWPFWRQNVYDTFKRASLPVPVVPLLNAIAAPKIKRKIEVIEDGSNE